MRDAVDAAGAAVLDAMAPWSAGGVLINFLGRASEPDNVRLVWPQPILERLQAVKRAWDPERRFRFGYEMD
ncbi:BBE domain-containing protein [Tomitella biformata]|uniref:BBE domain-containing protein n=1 Tax=Tomitella biformata TaxID=630403 RepID=UPI0004BC50AC|nr:BBE domain-containing protein [Tomitella biformata]